MNDEVVVLRAPARFKLAELARLAEPVLQRAGALRAVAFGSFARGAADGYSDLDLAVVLRTELPAFGRGELLKDLFDALPVGLDLVVYTPEEFERGMQARMGVFDAIAREGVTIYERAEG